MGTVLEGGKNIWNESDKFWTQKMKRKTNYVGLVHIFLIITIYRKTKKNYYELF